MWQHEKSSNQTRPLYTLCALNVSLAWWLRFVCWLVGCLTSQQQASVSQGRICTENLTCCHTEIQDVDPTFYLTQSQYTDTGPTSHSADPITHGRVATGVPILSHWYDSTPEKIPAQAGFEPGIFRPRGGRLNHKANEVVVVKASVSRAADQDSNPAFSVGVVLGRFSPETSTFGISVVTVPCVWHHRVSAGTGPPGVSIMSLGEIENWI